MPEIAKLFMVVALLVVCFWQHRQIKRMTGAYEREQEQIRHMMKAQDDAIAAATRRAKTPKAVECEAW